MADKGTIWDFVVIILFSLAVVALGVQELHSNYRFGVFEDSSEESTGDLLRQFHGDPKIDEDSSKRQFRLNDEEDEELEWKDEGRVSSFLRKLIP